METDKVELETEDDEAFDSINQAKNPKLFHEEELERDDAIDEEEEENERVKFSMYCISCFFFTFGIIKNN
jgi:hypothetical protein